MSRRQRTLDLDSLRRATAPRMRCGGRAIRRSGGACWARPRRGFSSHHGCVSELLGPKRVRYVRKPKERRTPPLRLDALAAPLGLAAPGGPPPRAPPPARPAARASRVCVPVYYRLPPFFIDRWLCALDEPRLNSLCLLLALAHQSPRAGDQSTRSIMNDPASCGRAEPDRASSI